jgi:ABC-type glycerol-3-phosphate transport system substrate-binding protein
MTAVERGQVVYGSDVYAVSLGVSIPALVASDAFEISDEALTWDELLGSLNLEDSEASSDVDADLEALVDRFLMVLGTLSQQNPNYGLLFELQSMTPRLTKPEFIEAADMLKQLSRQPGGLLSVLGTHDDAWKWVAENSEAVVAIAVPNQLSNESREIKTGKFIRIQSISKVPAWNVGGAMVAALAGNCRQSEQAFQFLQWIQRENTRNALQAAVVGVDSNTPPAGADQLSWRVRQQQLSFLKSESVPAEPSLPYASAYRVALGQALEEFVRGEVSARDALAKAQTAWEAITRDAEWDMRNEYEKSLGLTL